MKSGTGSDTHDLRQALRGLSGRDRRRVRLSVTRGEPILDDNRLAALAVAYARWRRTLPDRSRYPVFGLMRLGFMTFGWVVVAFSAYLVRSWPQWRLIVPLAVLAIVAQWAIGLAVRRTAARAEAANLAVIQDDESSAR